MSSPESQPHPQKLTVDGERKPGRSFSDPSRPLGEDVIERGDPLGGSSDEGMYGRSSIHDKTQHGVAERAKCVSVLRKAEELMASGNPSGATEEGRRRAIELACGRAGVRVHEYDVMLANDEEIQSLHNAVMDAARTHSVKL